MWRWALVERCFMHFDVRLSSKTRSQACILKWYHICIASLRSGNFNCTSIAWIGRYCICWLTLEWLFACIIKSSISFYWSTKFSTLLGFKNFHFSHTSIVFSSSNWPFVEPERFRVFTYCKQFSPWIDWSTLSAVVNKIIVRLFPVRFSSLNWESTSRYRHGRITLLSTRSWLISSVVKF